MRTRKMTECLLQASTVSGVRDQDGRVIVDLTRQVVCEYLKPIVEKVVVFTLHLGAGVGWWFRGRDYRGGIGEEKRCV
jgi:hypothetical protein